MDHIYDVIILGAGPAGLSAGLYAGRSRLDTLIIEKGQAGGQIINTDEIENYPGQIVEGETGVSLIRRMYEQTEQFGAEHVRDTITNAELSGDIKVLTGEKDTYQAKNIIIATVDDGVLTDSKGRKIDFSNTIIIMTSNLGATALRDDKTVGFGAKDIRFDQANMEKRMFEELKKTYRPEFINRIDEKVVFHSLSSEDMQQVVKVMVKPLIATLAEQGMTLKFQPSALKLLATKGYDPEMGARPLRRVLQTEVEDQLAELLLKGQAQEGQTIKVGTTAGTIKFEIV